MSARVNRASSLVRNTIAQSAGSFSGYIFSFISAPVILAGLGLRNFGIWALTGALAQYGALLDLGVGGALARHIAIYEEDRRVCGQYLAVGWLAIGTIFVVLASASLIAAAPLSHALHGVSTGQMHAILLSSVVLMTCAMLTGLIASYPVGRRRMVVPNVGLGIANTINFVASVGSIALGAKLVGYALANAGAAVLGVLVVAVVVVRSEGTLPFAIPERQRVRSFLGFSIKAQLVRISNLVNFQTDKVVIAFAVGPSAAGAYELANRVAIAIREVGIYVTFAMNVELASIFRRFGLKRVKERYARLNEVTAALAFPPVLLAMATAPLLLGAWLSHAPPNSVPVLVALAAAYLPSVSTGVGYGVAVAVGYPGITARSAVGASIANIILTTSLAPLFGIWGVLAGTVVALSGGAIAQVILVHRRFSLPASSYLGAVLPALRMHVILAIPLALIAYSHVVHHRATEALMFVVLAVGYLSACMAWAVKAGRLPPAVTSKLPRRVVALLTAPPRGSVRGWMRSRWARISAVDKRNLAIVAAVAAAARLVLILAYSPVLTNDSYTYLDLAHRIGSLNLHGFSGGRTPGYPVVLWAVHYSPLAAWCVQALLGVLATVLVYGLARRLGAGTRVALAAGLLYALDLEVLAIEHMVLTETLASLLLLVAGHLAVTIARTGASRGAALGLGAVLAYLCLVRPDALALSAYLALALALCLRRRRVLAILILPVVVLAAWAGVNRATIGVTSVSTVIGYNMIDHVAAHVQAQPGPDYPITSAYIAARARRLARTSDLTNLSGDARPEMERASHLDAAHVSGRLLGIAIGVIEHHPLAYVASSVKQWPHFWLAPNYAEGFASGRQAGLIRVIWKLQRTILAVLAVLFVLLAVSDLALRALRRGSLLTPASLVLAGVPLVGMLPATFLAYGESGRYGYVYFPLVLSVTVGAAGLRATRSLRRRPTDEDVPAHPEYELV